MNFYAILGVPQDADINDIKQKYRKLVKECHPDIHPGDVKAEERFKQISQAYAVLADKEKRKEYDKELNGRKTADVNQKKKKSGGSQDRRQPFQPEDFAKEFSDFFGFTAQNAPEKEKKDAKDIRRNPLDTSAIFEKYMGFK